MRAPPAAIAATLLSFAAERVAPATRGLGIDCTFRPFWGIIFVVRFLLARDRARDPRWGKMEVRAIPEKPLVFQVAARRCFC